MGHEISGAIEVAATMICHGVTVPTVNSRLTSESGTDEVEHKRKNLGRKRPCFPRLLSNSLPRFCFYLSRTVITRAELGDLIQRHCKLNLYYFDRTIVEQSVVYCVK